MRAGGVVMLSVFLKHGAQVSLTDDEHPVGALSPDSPYPALGIGVEAGDEGQLRLSSRRRFHFFPATNAEFHPSSQLLPLSCPGGEERRTATAQLVSITRSSLG